MNHENFVSRIVSIQKYLHDLKTPLKAKGFHGMLEYHVYVLFNPLKAELNPICHLLPLLEAHPILHISRINVNNAVLYVH